jgi:hypothetical protein
MKVYAHCLVRNEERFLWFSVMSVIDHLDKVFIWDTGSSDKTLQIIKEIERVRPGKVYFKEIGEVDPNEFTLVRQKMLNETDSDWLILVDGDEVWWEDSIKKITSVINENENRLDSIVSEYLNPVGDIYHFQDKEAGGYKIDGKSGFFNIRAMNRKINGLKVEKPHGQQGYFNKDSVLIQDMDKEKRMFMNGPDYLHFTNLKRSSKNLDLEVPKRKMKYKYELGKSFPLDFYYPEVFFRPRPNVVDSPWIGRSSSYFLKAAFETPLKIFKRRFLPKPKSGY